jgi:hypothetical protein
MKSQVALPWKSDFRPESLLNNRKAALKRGSNLTRCPRVNYYNSFASHALIGCRRCSRDRMSLITMITHALRLRCILSDYLSG